MQSLKHLESLLGKRVFILRKESEFAIPYLYGCILVFHFIIANLTLSINSLVLHRFLYNIHKKSIVHYVLKFRQFTRNTEPGFALERCN